MVDRLKCHICKRSFTQKSSLVRHSKRCTPGPAPSLRQKSCRACTTSKTKCDLRRPKCSRCEQRDTTCEYVIPMTRGTRIYSTSDEDEESSGHSPEDTNTHSGPSDTLVQVCFAEAPQALLSADMDLNLNTPLSSFGFASHAETSSVPVLNLIADKDTFDHFHWTFPSMNSDNVAHIVPPPSHYGSQSAISSSSSPSHDAFLGDDWLLWARGPEQNTPPLVKHSMETLLRVMKTWPKMLAKGFQTPPMMHLSNTHPSTILQPMINCLNISSMWAEQGDENTETVRMTVIQEMRAIFEQYRAMDERHLLSALQSLVMYTVMLLFPGRGQVSVSLVDPAIFLCLQKVVSHVAKTGLMLSEERDNKRPSWESWIHVTAKRRAVFSLYLLHWSYAVYHGLESFACTQLGYMPAPAPKFLWLADTREKWEALYDRWLSQWGDFPYMMREFAAIQANTSLERRTEIWLEDADELGVLFFSIVNATERGQNRIDNYYANSMTVLS